MSKMSLLVGAGIGYVLGARAGHERYEQIKGWVSGRWNDPRTQAKVEDLEGQASALKDKATDKVKSAVETVRGATSDDSSDVWSESESEVRSTPPAGTTAPATGF